MPWRLARRLTTNRPMRRAVSGVTSAPDSRVSLIWRSDSSGMPRPESLTSMVRPPGAGAVDSVTLVDGRGVGQGVVDELGEQVDQVTGRGLADPAVEGRADAHALVVLHTGGRGLGGLGDREALPAGGPGGGVGEDQQRVGRTTHARREVVEAEEALQSLGVLLVLLQRLDEVQLLVDEGRVAARQRHEHLADLATQLGLTGGERHGLAVEVVHGAGQLTDLLVRVDVDRHELGRLAAGADPGDGVGQVLVGDLEGALTDPTDRAEQRAGDDEREGDGREQREEGERGVEEGTLTGVGRRGGEALVDLRGAGTRPACRTRRRRRRHRARCCVPVRTARVRSPLLVRRVRTAALGVVERAGETVDGGALGAELGVEGLRDAAAAVRVGAEGLLHREGEATTERLGEELEAGLGGVLRAGDRGDQLGDTGLQLAQLRDPGVRAQRGGVVVTDRAAQVEQGGDLETLLVGQAGGLGGRRSSSSAAALMSSTASSSSVWLAPVDDWAATMARSAAVR